ncbi:type II secretion system protein [Sporomusa sp.]|uniref:type II secretion system protein n=1 Tax=Sporomusa sp. TaxID=2078658 RepID=UPI002C7C5A50|nr:prepilin-type N-terminal cleavage/methylation domain-containing protein [Sporomusa sp.]HWR08208.1 prepilin-type N-terminal cleavage/methylation domain-containing protein [Sporomusa sp.]
MIMSLRKSLKNQKGFTLVELMVVIAIIGILAAIAVPKLATSTDSAKVAKIQADLRTIGGALAVYYANHGSYPTTLGALVTENLLAAEPKTPDNTTSYTYPITGKEGVASAVFKGKTYYSDGTSETPATTPPAGS